MVGAFRLASCSLVLVVLGLASRAAAEPAPVLAPLPHRDQAYDRLIDEAVTEFDAEHFEEALALFEHAYAVRPSARAKRGMAKALFELRAYVRCVAAIDEALSGLVDPLPQAMRAEQLALRERAMRFVGRVELLTTPPHATVLVDGHPAPDARNGAMDLEIGPHVLEVTAPGHQSARRTVVVRGGDAARASVNLEALPPQGGPPPGTSSSSSASSSGIPPATLLVVAGALGLGGVAASTLWLFDRNAAMDQCIGAASRGARCENGDSIVFQRDMSVAAVAFSSVATVAAGAVLFLELRDRPRRAALGCRGAASHLSCGVAGTW